MTDLAPRDPDHNYGWGKSASKNPFDIMVLIDRNCACPGMPTCYKLAFRRIWERAVAGNHFEVFFGQPVPENVQDLFHVFYFETFLNSFSDVTIRKKLTKQIFWRSFWHIFKVCVLRRHGDNFLF